MTDRLVHSWLGRVPYADAHARQVELRDAIARGEGSPTLLLLEHDPIVTLGRRGESGDLLTSRTEMAGRGIEFAQAERGGQATYHGPGQLVGYLVARVRDLAPSLPILVEGIEDALIATCADLGVTARCDGRQHGVWAGHAKIGFIGLAVRHGICWHGFSLNVDLDLAPFDLIRPCGLDDEVTSIVASGGQSVSVPDVAELTARHLSTL